MEAALDKSLYRISPVRPNRSARTSDRLWRRSTLGERLGCSQDLFEPSCGERVQHGHATEGRSPAGQELQLGAVRLPRQRPHDVINADVARVGDYLMEIVHLAHSTRYSSCCAQQFALGACMGPNSRRDVRHRRYIAHVLPVWEHREMKLRARKRRLAMRRCSSERLIAQAQRVLGSPQEAMAWWGRAAMGLDWAPMQKAHASCALSFSALSTVSTPDPPID